MKRILMVDDTEAMRTMASKYIEMFLPKRFNITADVDTSIDGINALDMLPRGNYDLLVTDGEMPRMGGLELASKVKEDFPNLPIILYTSNVDVMNEANYKFKDNFVEVLLKGNASELVDAVGRYFSQQSVTK